MQARLLLVLATLSAASPAFAHAFLVRADPPVGSEMAAQPDRLTLTFTEGVEPLFSTIELRDTRGTIVPTDRPQTTAGNNRQLTVRLPKLASGNYTVVWHATSVDTHKTEGRYGFTVK
jgi:hypothetical protein